MFPLHPIKTVTCSTIPIPNGPPVYFTGPSLSFGKMPALFYFSLSGHASLCTDPYNQPVAFLSSRPMRIYSLTLPGHEQESHFTHAIKYWAEQIKQGNNIIQQFTEQVIQTTNYLIANGWIDAEKIAVAGLSRGAFIASHIAAQDPRIQWILGFSPLTKLTYASEFSSLQENPLAKSLNLQNLTNQLIGRQLRFYIGNRDVRVGTENCFEFISGLAEVSYNHEVRSPPVELIINPSQGRHGHGTLPDVFQDGASWLYRSINAKLELAESNENNKHPRIE
jgi:hypothetical protein